jgi:hypothetical protein
MMNSNTEYSLTVYMVSAHHNSRRYRCRERVFFSKLTAMAYAAELEESGNYDYVDINPLEVE